MWFLQKVRKPLKLSHSSEKVHMNESNFSKNPKNLILGPFQAIFGSF